MAVFIDLSDPDALVFDFSIVKLFYSGIGADCFLYEEETTKHCFTVHEILKIIHIRLKKLYNDESENSRAIWENDYLPFIKVVSLTHNQNNQGYTINYRYI